MTSTAQPNHADKFPAWATLVIAFVIAGYLGVYVAGILTIQAAQRLARELFDPKNIAMVANAIGGMPEKLPAGFSYRVGLSVNEETLKKWFGLPASDEKIKSLAVMGRNFLTIEHEPDGQQIVIVSSPQEEPVDSKEILEKAYEIGINTGKTAAHFRSILQRGETEVAGLPMPYVVGEIEDTNQNIMHGMMGGINLKDKHRAVLVYGVQPEGDSYNMTETQDLLRCIRGFQ